MLTLIKIRCKYLSNHLCSVYWNYFFIPSMTLISLFIFLKVVKYEKRYNEYSKSDGKDLKITKELFSNYINFSKYNLSFVSDDEKDKKIIQEIIKSDIEWSNHVSGIKKNNKIIKIINKNDRYKIEMIIKDGQDSLFYIYDLESFAYYDPFETSRGHIWLSQRGINSFIELQSLFAQFLIKKKEFIICRKN